MRDENLTWICTDCMGEFLGGVEGDCPGCKVKKLNDEKFIDLILSDDVFDTNSDYYQNNMDNYLPPEEDDGSQYGY